MENNSLLPLPSVEELGKMSPLFQCAESKIYRFHASPARSYIIKHRFPKTYRHPQLDLKLREQRTQREARALAKAAARTTKKGPKGGAGFVGVRVPTVYAVDKANSIIVMEDIRGVTLKEALDWLEKTLGEIGSKAGGNSSSASNKEKEEKVLHVIRQILRGIGEMVGLLHFTDTVHGDLTTSNILLQHLASPDTSNESRVREAVELYAKTQIGEAATAAGVRKARDNMVILDFGLVSNKNNAEEKAVDLYVLERALSSTHPTLFVTSTNSPTSCTPSDAVNPMDYVLEGYTLTMADEKKSDDILKKLKGVRARGRKRSMIG